MAGRFWCWQVYGDDTCQVVIGAEIETSGRTSNPHRSIAIWCLGTQSKLESADVDSSEAGEANEEMMVPVRKWKRLDSDST